MPRFDLPQLLQLQRNLLFLRIDDAIDVTRLDLSGFLELRSFSVGVSDLRDVLLPESLECLSVGYSQLDFGCIRRLTNLVKLQVSNVRANPFDVQTKSSLREVEFQFCAVRSFMFSAEIESISVTSCDHLDLSGVLSQILERLNSLSIYGQKQQLNLDLNNYPRLNRLHTTKSNVHIVSHAQNYLEVSLSNGQEIPATAGIRDLKLTGFDFFEGICAKRLYKISLLDCNLSWMPVLETLREIRLIRCHNFNQSMLTGTNLQLLQIIDTQTVRLNLRE